MSTRYLFYAIAFIVAGVIIWVAIDTFNQPGIKDLEVEFEEISTYRNANNTGPVIRIYAVYAPDTAWQQMKAYGDFMPHTKYGNTKVIFFDNKEYVPEIITPTDPIIQPEFQPHCIAIYEKTAMGEVKFSRFPFR